MKYLFLLFFFALQLVGFAQQKSKPLAVVAATSNYFVFKIINNSISVAVSGHYNKDIVVKTSVGTIEKVSDYQYILNVGKCSENSLILSVYLKKSNGKLEKISESDFVIKDFPKPYILFDQNERSGFISKSKLNRTFGIYFILPYYFPNCEIRFSATEFLVKHKHKDGSISIFKVTKTHVLSKEILESFKNAEDGDTIMIYDVTVNGLNGIEKLPDELIFIVKEI